MNKKKKIARKLYESPRFAALSLLVQVTENQAYSNLLVSDAIKNHKLEGKDAGLMTEIVYGTISRQLTLEYYLAPFITSTKKIDNWVHQLLLLSLYQLEYLDKVPDHAILNEAVEIAKAQGNPGIGKFVNGVLRAIQRKGVASVSEIKDDMERLSVETSIPLWLTEKLVADMGYDDARELGFSLLEPSKASARINRMNRDDVIAALEYEGFDIRASEVAEDGVVADKGFLAGSDLFQQGFLTIQDESSMLVAPSMTLDPFHQVLDACAAPGGKTTHIATYLTPAEGGKITALDIHQHKIRLIKENAERLEVEEVIESMVLDARKSDETFEDEQFDRILVDAPCSGLGLLRRKPDIKYTKSQEDFARLQRIQLAILESVSKKVKVCGIITYSTCTITSEENREVVTEFLDTHDNFELVDIEAVEHLTKSYEGKMLQIYPHHYQTDGFFISCLRRKA